MPIFWKNMLKLAMMKPTTKAKQRLLVVQFTILLFPTNDSIVGHKNAERHDLRALRIIK